MDELLEHRREELRSALDGALGELPDGVNAEGELLEGDPAEALCARGDGSIDMLFTGSRSYGHWHRVMLGSVSARLMQSAPFPVVVATGRHDGDAPA